MAPGIQPDGDDHASPAPAPDVSVVVATYNQESTLRATVEGIMAQTFQGDLELIVVDDASSDGTWRLLEELARDSRRPLVRIRLAENQGAGMSRNAGLDRARGRFIAITDSDCVPAPGWLEAALAAFSSPEVGVVQGRVVPMETRTPFFSHFIVTEKLDGTFCTSNIVYRREALGEKRFNEGCWYWHDVDLGMRILTSGWQARFSSQALVYHQVLPMRPWRWLTWTIRYGNAPARVARYPEARRYLFLRFWVTPLHLTLELALVGVALAFWHPLTLVLVLPYVALFLRQRGRGLAGRFPPGKAALHLGRDLIGVGSLVVGSFRYRRVVL